MCYYYFSNIKSVKWYKKVFLYGLEASVVNAFILYKFYRNNLNIKLIDFRMNIIETLVKSLNSEKNYINKNYYDQLKGKYFIEKNSQNRQRKCVVCKTRSTYECDICKVSLFIDKCFKIYYKKIKIDL